MAKKKLPVNTDADSDVYEELILETVHETKKLQNQVRDLVDNLTEAAEDFETDKSTELLKALAESNILILDKLKELEQKDSKHAQQFSDVRKRLETLVDEEKKRLHEDLDSLSSGLKVLESELKEVTAGSKDLTNVHKEFNELSSKLDSVLARLNESPSSKHLEPEVKRVAEKVKTAEKTISKAQVELTNSLKKELNALRREIKDMRLDLDSSEVMSKENLVGTELEISELEKRLRQALVKTGQTSHPDLFDEDIKNITRDVSDLKNSLDAIRERSKQYRATMLPREKKLVEHAEQIRAKTQTLDEKLGLDHLKKIKSVHQASKLARDKVIDLDETDLKLVTADAVKIKKDLNALHKDVSQKKMPPSQALKRLETQQKRIESKIHPVIEKHAALKGHAQELSDHALNLEDLKIITIDAVKTADKTADTVMKDLTSSSVRIEHAPGREEEDPDLKKSGKIFENAASESKNNLIALKPKHAEAHEKDLKETQDSLESVISKVKERQKSHEQLEKELSQIAKTSERLEKKLEGTKAGDAAKQIREKLEAPPTTKEVLEKLETAQEKVKHAGKAEHLPELEKVKLEKDLDRVIAKLKEYMEGQELGTVKTRNAKAYNLKAMCASTGVDYDYAVKNLKEIKNRLGNEFKVKNKDVISRLQGKEILIEKKSP